MHLHILGLDEVSEAEADHIGDCMDYAGSDGGVGTESSCYDLQWMRIQKEGLVPGARKVKLEV